MDITELLRLSASRGASDLHLSAGLAPMLRIDGDIRPVSYTHLTLPTIYSV